MPTNANVTRRALDAHLALERMWGSGPVGLILTEAYFTETVWLTAPAVAAKTGGLLSDDTARRKLDALVNVGRAECRDEGYRRLYRALPKQAEETVAVLRRIAAP